MENPKCVVVLGMHRSGTSALTGCLNLLGVYLGEKLFQPHPVDNAKGYWENEGAVTLDDELLTSLGRSWDDERSLPHGWGSTDITKGFQEKIQTFIETEFQSHSLWGLKDPRMSRLMAAWLPAIEKNATPHILLALRDPQEVAASLSRRDGMARDRAHLLWLRHMLEAESSSRNLPRTVISYDSLLKDWRSTLTPVVESINPAISLEDPELSRRIDDFLTPGLRHFATKTSSTESVYQELSEKAYNIFLSSESTEAMEQFDSIQSSVDEVFKNTIPWAEEIQHLKKNNREIELELKQEKLKLSKLRQRPKRDFWKSFWPFRN